jgi:Protein of unknown function (DUF2505)
MRHLSTLSLAPEAILVDLTSEAFLREFSEEVGVTVGSLELSEQGARQRARLEWTFTTDRAGIPELARRFLPDRVSLTWDQIWGPVVSGAASGDLTVLLKGRPAATVTGRSVLSPGGSPTGNGSTLTTETRTEADLPFPVASRVERLIDRDLAGWILSVQTRVLARRADAGLGAD